jgi:hypothetical protein
MREPSEREKQIVLARISEAIENVQIAHPGKIRDRVEGGITVLQEYLSASREFEDDPRRAGEMFTTLVMNKTDEELQLAWLYMQRVHEASERTQSFISKALALRELETLRKEEKAHGK